MSVISSLVVHGGELTWWLPTSTAFQSFSTSEPDPRPLTPDQLRHVEHTAVRDDDEANPWIGVRCQLVGATDASIAGALRRYFTRHESLRCAIVPDEDQTYHRRLVDPEHIEFIGHRAGWFDDVEELRATMLAEFDAATGALGWPAACIATVTDHAGHVTLYATFDHITFDGYSAYLTLGELPQLHREELSAATAPPEAGSYIDFAITRAQEHARVTRDDIGLLPWTVAADADGCLPGLPSATGVTRDDAPYHRVRFTEVVDRATTDLFVDRCRLFGLSPALGFTTILLKSILAEEPDPSITFLMSTHNRNDPAHHRSIGWFSGIVPVSVTLDPSLGLARAVERVGTAWQVSKAAAGIPLPLANELLGTRMRPALVTSFMDSRHCPGFESWAADDAIFLGDVAPSDEMHLWINAMPWGTELINRIPDTPECVEWLERVLDRMRTQMRESIELESTGALA